MGIPVVIMGISRNSAKLWCSLLILQNTNIHQFLKSYKNLINLIILGHLFRQHILRQQVPKEEPLRLVLKPSSIHLVQHKFPNIGTLPYHEKVDHTHPHSCTR